MSPRGQVSVRSFFMVYGRLAIYLHCPRVALPLRFFLCFRFASSFFLFFISIDGGEAALTSAASFISLMSVKIELRKGGLTRSGISRRLNIAIDYKHGGVSPGDNAKTGK